ncbi:neprilysin-2-like [Stegodyphus dumicola]|uniref:neprilysin-2-like n=1 Tax=Stegodyphus dumicola TaxID=202533 RepID=UPI0015AF7A44|nr:neprilysin-2-like [Stegodyphus dumicola]
MNFLRNVCCWLLLFHCICMTTDGNANPVSYSCVTNDCYKAAESIKSYLDTSVDPCDDFYQFACGGWMRKNIIFKNDFYTSVFSKLVDSVISAYLYEEMQPYVQQIENPCGFSNQFACEGWKNRPALPENTFYVSVLNEQQQFIPFRIYNMLHRDLTGNEAAFVEKIKSQFDNCMYEDKIETEQHRPLVKVLRKIVQWPIVEGDYWSNHTLNSQSSWTRILFKLRNLGYNHNILFTVSVIKDPTNISLNIIKLDKPSFGIDRQSLLNGINDNSTASYLELMMKAAHLLDLNNGSSIQFTVKQNIKKEMEDALNFEIMLANISSKYEYLPYRRQSNQRITVQDLNNRMPQINWIRFLNKILVDPVSASEPLIIFNLDCLEEIIGLINRTNSRVVANYMVWRVVHQSLPLLSRNWRTLEHRSIEHPLVFDLQIRWRYCISSITDNYLGMAISSYYILTYLEKTYLNAAQSMIENIHEAFENMLSNATWMDEETKQRALVKARTITYHIAYKEELLNVSYIFDLYRDLNISGNYFVNALKVRKWATDMDLSRLRRPEIMEALERHAKEILVNPTYNHKDNSIVLRAGLFHQPFFDKTLPNYLNFGALGSLIGHELTHAFLGTGRQFDGNGNSVNWWSDYTERNFEQKSDCFIQQYSKYRMNYTSGGDNSYMLINGAETLDENIADAGGLRAAYLAYQSWVENNTNEPKLADLIYTPKQLFWISAANARCENADGLFYATRYTCNSHIPQQFRVIGSMSNFPEFVQDFNCSSDRAMNRKNKCKIW